MSTVAQVQAAAPSFVRRAKDPHPRITAKRNSGTEARMGWWCKTSESAAAFAVIGGTVESFTVFGETVNRIVPLRHPTYPWLIADEIEAEDMGWEKDATTGVTGETDTHIVISFKSPNYETSGDMPFIEFAGNSSPRQVPGPPSAYYAAHQPFQALDEQANGSDFTLTLHQMPAFGLGDWISRANSVNLYPFFGCPPGSLMFMGPSWHQSQQLGGVTSWQVGLGFKATDPTKPWNYGYLASGAWGKILNAAGNPLYPEINFDALFVG